MSCRTAWTVRLLLALAIGGAGFAEAGTISVAWDALSHPNLVGYRVFYGTTSGTYSQTVDVGLTTQATLTGLTDCTTYYVAVKGRASDGSLSPTYSSELSGWSRPTVTASNPTSIARGSTGSVTLTGTNFRTGATAFLSDASIVVNSVTVNSCTQAVVNLTVPATSGLGAKNVSVRNTDQTTGTGTGILTVTNAAPNGTITAPSSSATITAGGTVTFAGSATDPDNTTPFTYRWDFGDPAIADSTAQNPGAKQFNTAGTFSVTFTVTDGSGLADPTPATVSVTVNAAQAPAVTNIQAGLVGSTTATVTWTTDKSSDSQVLYRKVGETVFQQTPIDATLVTSHSVALAGLAPDTDYEYSVRSADSGGLATTQAAGVPFTTQTNSFVYLRVESESAAIGAPAQIVTDATAFRGAYIRLASGTSTGTANNPSGTWNYGVNVPSTATWYFWYRMFSPATTSNTWLERVNGGSFQSITTTQNNAWQWIEGRSYGLTGGVHTLTLGGQEALTRIDRMLVTNDPAFVPTEAPNGDTTPPAPATGFTANAGDTVVTLGWTNPAESGAFRVVVRYKTTGGYPLHPLDGLPLADNPGSASSAESLAHTGLSNGTTYSYAVFIVDAAGNASTAATAQATPEPPPQPLGTVQGLRRSDTTP
jgi:PKD domain/Purple acid Phosphatase, N-terminal domain/Fibronectin type III domain